MNYWLVSYEEQFDHTLLEHRFYFQLLNVINIH